MIKQSSFIYTRVASEPGDNTFPNRVLDLCYEQFHSFVELKSTSTIKQEWLYYFTANGCSGVLAHWIKNGMKEEVTELANFMAKLIIKTQSISD